MTRGAYVAVCLLAVAGCGQPTATVTGTVRYQGKPLVCGNVTLVASSGVAFAGSIRPDGSYSIPDVPTGPVKLGVTSLDPNLRPEAAGRYSGRDTGTAGGKDRPPSGPPAPPVVGWFAIPAKYMHPGSSGLTGRVEPNSPLHIDLK